MTTANAADAHLELFATDRGGKRKAITTGYRGGLLIFPEWFSTWDERGGERHCIGATVALRDREELAPGESAMVRLYFWAPEALAEIRFESGTEFRLWEGQFVGRGTISEPLNEKWPGRWVPDGRG